MRCHSLQGIDDLDHVLHALSGCHGEEFPNPSNVNATIVVHGWLLHVHRVVREPHRRDPRSGQRPGHENRLIGPPSAASVRS